MMRARLVRWLVLAMGILVLAGCRRTQSATVKITPIPPLQPFVFYDETGEPSARTPMLSEAELREILDKVVAQTSDPVWLIRIKPALPGEERGLVIVYLVPDETTPRIRAGRFYAFPPPQRKADGRPPGKYAQVSLPNCPFTAQLAKPSVAELPFDWPVITDPSVGKSAVASQKELIVIVDLARQPSSYEALTGGSETAKSRTVRAILERPIRRVWIGENDMCVSFGFQHAPLWGRGWDVILERTPTGYRIKGWGSWVS